MSRPFSPRNFSSASFVRVNGKIRAREVRLIGVDSKQLGIVSLGDALNLARTHGVDLVEIAASATPPVCRLVDYGKYRYEQAKKDKESKKHQHATQVKEVQLSPRIDPHDLSVKIGHAVNFLCEDMKVKVALKFRGREMQHTEFGFQVINKFIAEVAPYGHPDFVPKLVGRAINLMVSPLPRAKRAKNPHQQPEAETPRRAPASGAPDASAPGRKHPSHPEHKTEHNKTKNGEQPAQQQEPSPGTMPDGFSNNPFSSL